MRYSFKWGMREILHRRDTWFGLREPTSDGADRFEAQTILGWAGGGSTLNRWARHQKIAFNSQHHVWNGQELISWLSCFVKRKCYEELSSWAPTLLFQKFNSIYLFWDDRFNWQKGKLEGGGVVAHWYKLLFNKKRLIHMPKTCSSHLQLH